MKRFPLFLLALFLMTAAVMALTVRPVPAGYFLGRDGERWVVRAYFDDRAMVHELASWRAPWEVNDKENYVVLDVDQQEAERLKAAGFRLEIDHVRTAELNRPRTLLPGQVQGIPGYPCYRTVEETYATAQALAAQHPQLVSWIDVGDSWEKTTAGGTAGYDLMVLRLSNAAILGPKPKLFVMSSVHGREYTTAEISTRFAEYLVQNYGDNADITWLLDYHEIHLLLQANPDGRKHAESGWYWRKNTNDNYCSATSTNRGADLNRNFSFHWGCCDGSSSNTCFETYRGPAIASEPETQAIEDYVRAQFRDLRDDALDAAAAETASGVFLDLHSYGELVLWPWGFTDEPPPNDAALQTLGRKLAFFNDYVPQQAINLYPTDGTTDAFAYGELGLAAYSIELGTSFFQSCYDFENVILPDNLPALMYAAKVARTPYLTAAGPEVMAITTGSAAVGTGSGITLTATVDDTRYSELNGTESVENITAVEFYVNVPPWVTTTMPISNTMVATDGALNSPVEAVQGAIDTTDLTVGKHIVFMRAKDAANHWGAVSAAFFYIYDPAVSPVIQGYVREADGHEPLEATVSFSQYFTVTTDPQTGFYSTNVLSGTYELTASSPRYGAHTVSGVTAHDYQIIQHDFVLYPYCHVAENDVESGLSGWTAQLPWTISAERAHSPLHAWTDSPGGAYANYQDTSLTSPIFDLSAYNNVKLTFWHICRTEAGFDYCLVEISDDGGGTWREIARYDGYRADWEEESLALPLLDEQPNGRIRFRFTSDSGVTNDGWYVDDIRLTAAGPACSGLLTETSIYLPLIGR